MITRTPWWHCKCRFKWPEDQRQAWEPGSVYKTQEPGTAYSHVHVVGSEHRILGFYIMLHVFFLFFTPMGGTIVSSYGLVIQHLAMPNLHNHLPFHRRSICRMPAAWLHPRHSSRFWWYYPVSRSKDWTQLSVLGRPRSDCPSSRARL